MGFQPEIVSEGLPTLHHTLPISQVLHTAGTGSLREHGGDTEETEYVETEVEAKPQGELHSASLGQNGPLGGLHHRLASSPRVMLSRLWLKMAECAICFCFKGPPTTLSISCRDCFSPTILCSGHLLNPADQEAKSLGEKFSQVF